MCACTMCLSARHQQTTTGAPRTRFLRTHANRIIAFLLASLLSDPRTMGFLVPVPKHRPPPVPTHRPPPAMCYFPCYYACAPPPCMYPTTWVPVAAPVFVHYPSPPTPTPWRQFIHSGAEYGDRSRDDYPAPRRPVRRRPSPGPARRPSSPSPGPARRPGSPGRSVRIAGGYKVFDEEGEASDPLFHGREFSMSNSSHRSRDNLTPPEWPATEFGTRSDIAFGRTSPDPRRWNNVHDDERDFGGTRSLDPVSSRHRGGRAEPRHAWEGGYSRDTAF